MTLRGTGITPRGRQYSVGLEQMFDEFFFTSQLFDRRVSEPVFCTAMLQWDGRD
jgi:hypothetical protein